jgi:hypothetical protein
LKESEKDLLVKIRACVEPLITLKKPSHSFSPTKDLAYAVGVSVSLVKQCLTQQITNNGSNEQKQWTDDEDTIITRIKRRTQVWTAEHYFKKQHK